MSISWLLTPFYRLLNKLTRGFGGHMFVKRRACCRRWNDYLLHIAKIKKKVKDSRKKQLLRAMDDGALMPKLVLYHLCPLKHSSIRNPKAACIVELCFFFEGKV